ncbi:MAG: NAD(P)/FAD-dependent oxidoreductase [Gammaproteobacteria bacterium]|nr:NAD(P)/FAD-dependent oxidoreductase [Gammaproteobacteria bacterium]
MCAVEAGKRGRKVLVLDHANKIGKKILMSGGGRCNFTNYYIEPDKYISHNPHFCKSALSRYTQWDFISLVQKYKIHYHEKTLGQLFCNNKSKDIVDLLLAEINLYNITIKLDISIISIEKNNKFKIVTESQNYSSGSLVIATGGLSIPTMGASGFAYNIARQFGLNIYPTRAGLVPVTLQPGDLNIYSQLSGVACPAKINSKCKEFVEDLLFTHRGLSGPVVLQISNYWMPGEDLSINLAPDKSDILNIDSINNNIKNNPELLVKNFLIEYLNLPKRVINLFVEQSEKFENLAERKLKTLNPNDLSNILDGFINWQIKPNGTEGYRTAEVTIGGIDCNELSSKTMETTKVAGLYFIGECLDVTGWLGGYNFQWAWSSGYAAGQYV